MKEAEVYTGAAVMGAVAGLRSMTAPATVSQLARRGLPIGSRSLGFLNSVVSMRATIALAVGELIADKLPFLPSRTKPPSLIVRAVSGALCGAAVCSAKKKSVFAGILIGAAAAIGASYGAYELRKHAGKALHVPDPVIAVAEDALAVGTGLIVLSRLRESEV